VGGASETEVGTPEKAETAKTAKTGQPETCGAKTPQTRAD
jgi:hypothetical protein